jgi:hypothetical protein
MSSIMSRLPYMSRILFWSIAKHVRILFWSIVRILFWSIAKYVRIASDACCCIFNIRSTIVSKYLKLVKRQARDRYERFASPSSHRCIAPPPSHQVVGSSSCRHIAPPPPSDDSIMEMWEVPPPPLTCLEEASSDSSSSSSSYNDECPHVK